MQWPILFIYGIWQQIISFTRSHQTEAMICSSKIPFSLQIYMNHGRVDTNETLSVTSDSQVTEFTMANIRNRNQTTYLVLTHVIHYNDQ